MIEQQELYCHNCGRYVQFELDIEVNGNYVLDCPNCGHEHCRVVNNGRITDIRWDSRNGSSPNGLPTIYVTGATSSTTSVDYALSSATLSTSASLSTSSWTWYTSTGTSG